MATYEESLTFLRSLPRPSAMVTFTYRDFDGNTKHGDARVKPCQDDYGQDGFYVVGSFGCGKTREDVRVALKEYLGGRELVSHQHYF